MNTPGVWMGIFFVVMGSCGLGTTIGRRMGYNEATCDTACGAQAEYNYYGDKLRCICGGTTVKLLKAGRLRD